MSDKETKVKISKENTTFQIINASEENQLKR